MIGESSAVRAARSGSVLATVGGQASGRRRRWRRERWERWQLVEVLAFALGSLRFGTTLALATLGIALTTLLLAPVANTSAEVVVDDVEDEEDV